MDHPRLNEHAPFLPAADAPPVEWRTAPGLTAYADAVAEMEALAEAIAAGRATERVWLVEHPALYTAGTSAKDGDLIEARIGRAEKIGGFTAFRAALPIVQWSYDKP